MKPGNVIRTHRPEQGRAAFVRAAWGLASMGHGVLVSTQGSFVQVGHCNVDGNVDGLLDQAEDLMHPGEGSA